MNKLLRANFARLLRNRIFQISMGLMFLLGVYFAFRNIRFIVEDVPLDRSIRQFLIPATLCLSVFTTLFVGTEYSDGAIRNKIAVGHGRGQIYLSNLCVCLAAGLLMCLAFLLPYLGLGLLFLNSPEAGATELLTMFSCALGAMMAFGSVFVLISMLCHSKAGSSILCSLLLFGLLLAATYVNSKLSEPETYSEYMLTASGVVTESAPKPNPNYVGGTERAILEYSNDAQPGGQILLVMTEEIRHPCRMLLWDAGIILCATLAGMWFFKRKDLK